METPDTERVQRGREYSQVEITEYQNGEIRANGIPINTPDIEWEKILDMWIEKDPDALLRHYIQALKLIIPKALSSRDTYWAERVEADRERIYDAIDDYFISPNPIPDAKILCGYIRETLKGNLEVCEACGERHITSEDNLK
ncbi:MAG: hypothetical protein IPO40_24500 [Fibrobacteres bacterium]|nr:hypothetical protein [Fibrobacterota bacterium]